MSTVCILKVLAGTGGNMKLTESKPKVLFELRPVVRIYAENNGKLSVPSGTVGTMGLGGCYKYTISLFLLSCDKDYSLLSSSFVFTPCV